MNPTPAAIALIIGQVSDWEEPDEEIVENLNDPTIPNPEPQGQVLPTLTIEGLVGILSPASTGNLWNSPNAREVRDAVRAQDRPGFMAWVSIALAGGAITEQEYANLAAAVQATIPDPNWPSHLSWAEVNLGRPVDLDDIQRARAEVTNG